MASTLARLIKVLEFDFGSESDLLNRLTSFEVAVEEARKQQTIAFSDTHQISDVDPEGTRGAQESHPADSARGRDQVDNDQESNHRQLVGIRTDGERTCTTGRQLCATRSRSSKGNGKDVRKEWTNKGKGLMFNSHISPCQIRKPRREAAFSHHLMFCCSLRTLTTVCASRLKELGRLFD